MRSLLRYICCTCIAALFLAGCTVRPPAVPVQADLPWTAFSRRMDSLPPMPGFSARMSVTTITDDGGHRLTADFWGTPAHPLRLDLQAGIGKTVSMLREDNLALKAYLPGENRVYHHPDPRTGTRLLGLKTPFSLAELADILRGNWSVVVPHDFRRVEATPNQSWRYLFGPEARIASAVIDAGGRVLEVRTRTGWTLTLDRFPEPPAVYPVAEKLTLTETDGDRIIIRIKSYTPRTEPWPSEKLELKVPKDVRYMLLVDKF
jgi:outer membrane biogenesis lipoprotein LolB